MSEAEEQGRPPAPLLDLFATAVHRFGSAWADLVAASVLVLIGGSVPVLVARASGASTGAGIAIGDVGQCTTNPSIQLDERLPARGRVRRVVAPVLPRLG